MASDVKIAARVKVPYRTLAGWKLPDHPKHTLYLFLKQKMEEEEHDTAHKRNETK